MQYENRETGACVLTGVVTGKTDNSFTLKVGCYDKEKGAYDSEYTIMGKAPENKDVSGKGEVTVVAYKAGKEKFTLDKVVSRNDSYAISEKCMVINGDVVRARLNEEKDKDGKVKQTKDGKPKKPHYDISIVDSEGVTHRVKVYNTEKNPDAIEKAAKTFDKLGSVKEIQGKNLRTKIAATLLTNPSGVNEYQYEDKDGVARTYRDYLGYFKADTKFYSEEVEKEQEQAAEQEYTPAEEEEELPFN